VTDPSNSRGADAATLWRNPRPRRGVTYVTAVEAAQILGVDRSRVTRLCASGRIPGAYVGLYLGKHQRKYAVWCVPVDRQGYIRIRLGSSGPRPTWAPIPQQNSQKLPIRPEGPRSMKRGTSRQNLRPCTT
jgi:hypothetical protein